MSKHGQTNRQPDQPTAAAIASQIADTATPPNRFLLHFPINGVHFKDDVRQPDKPWDDGTISQTLAGVSISLGDTDATIPAARIVFKKNAALGLQALDLQMPSSGSGKFRFSFIETKHSEQCRAEFEDWKRLVVAAWQDYRKRAVANGAATIKGMMPKVGIAVGDDVLNDLGIDLSTATPSKRKDIAPAPAPATPPVSTATT